MTAPWINQRTVSAAGLAGAVVAGAAIVKMPALAVLLCVGVVSLVALVTLGPRAFPAALVLVSVAPWYPLLSEAAPPPRVAERTLCFVIAAGATVPWLWSLGWGVRRERPRAPALLYGLLLATLTIMMYVSFGGLHDMFTVATFGFLFGGVAFLCARRFAGTHAAWPAAAFWGVVVLGVLGLATYASSPGTRIGTFVGYPITYGALLSGLAPPALLHASRRSRTAALALALGIAGLLILSQSRSSWIAACVLLLVLVALLVRLGRWREVAALAGIVLVAAAAIAQTGSLHKIVEARLSSSAVSSESVTHRQWSLELGRKELRERPFFGAGTPGFAGNLAADETDIGAVDNGYISIGIDLGLVGLIAALVPIGIAVLRLAGWIWAGAEPPAEDLALALGIVAIATVTFFYDSFYWAPLCLILGGMGGTLSARPAAMVPARSRRRRRRRRAPARRPVRAVR